MKLLLLLVCILILNFDAFINCQNLYANFIPYQSNGCTNEIEGIGFSFVATTDECYSKVGRSLNDVFNSNSEDDFSSTESSSSDSIESSWFIVIDALRVGVAEYDNDNSTCTGNFVNATSIKNGTCLSTPNFIPFIGLINNQNTLTQQFSLVTISKEPYYPDNVQVYSIFDNQSSDCDLQNLSYSVYFSTNLNISLKNNNNNQFFQTQCKNGIATNNLCNSSSNCNQIVIPDACDFNNDYGFDQIYCTSQ
ncbi:hypothetical protein DICPUDRAFT_156290 [Dictyostelium purpureum]|uniref:Transmembrane protein n=1 Tax=Dictyostelium purpureum TaxID=5786 RepID=F0ZW75_DICPU|nr:uncharacterized protein DICPUDRAFT_156290 [Dictyostelium purpureum]EGC31800.1 hypothetical protein DICPUDRAFT_156290 [Dictyostelium purpureum]|eukprot:XP_003291667.1 hypothetical protein DICPUDRAFT_156290 [Dictyostelium purpureum]